MSGAGHWIEDHKKEAALAAAATAATVLTAGAAAPAIAGGLGAAEAGAAAAAPVAAGTIAGAGATDAAIGTGAIDTIGSAGAGLMGDAATAQPATSGFASGLLQQLGHMGPEQANILAEQNAAFGMQTPGATMQTLSAANPTVNATLGQHGLLTQTARAFNSLGKGMQLAKAFGAFPSPAPIQNLQRPPSMGQQPPPQSTQQILGNGGASAPGALPPGALPPGEGMSPQLLELLRRLQQQR